MRRIITVVGLLGLAAGLAVSGVQAKGVSPAQLQRAGWSSVNPAASTARGDSWSPLATTRPSPARPRRSVAAREQTFARAVPSLRSLSPFAGMRVNSTREA